MKYEETFKIGVLIALMELAYVGALCFATPEGGKVQNLPTFAPSRVAASSLSIEQLSDLGLPSWPLCLPATNSQPQATNWEKLFTSFQISPSLSRSLTVTGHVDF